MKYGVMAMLFAVVAEAQEFADFDTEISTTSLVQEGETFAGVRLNPLGSLRDLREQSALQESPSLYSLRRISIPPISPIPASRVLPCASCR